jgi:hypothetical protein
METKIESLIYLGTKVPEKLNFEKLESTDRFLVDAIKGAGFSFQNCISEFIDNSLDAGSEKIKITTEPVNRKKDYFNLTIEDNGKGILHTEIKDIVKKIGYGNLSKYKQNSISNYGLGMKFALINLCESGICEITSVKDNTESTVFLDRNNEIPLVSEVSISETNKENGTKIYIPNVNVTSNQLTSLLKYLGVTYFPQVNNGNKLEIKMLFVKDDEVIEKDVEFTDPLYRNINSGISYKSGISVNNESFDVKYNGVDYRIWIKARHFDQSFNESDLSSWDKQQGAGSFSGNKSGVYFRLNGRYITLGNGEFYGGSNLKAGANRHRIEVDIDRGLIPLMGIGFNKSKIFLDKENTHLGDFLKELARLVGWCVQKYSEYNPQNKEVTSEEQQELDEINKDINARRRKMPALQEDSKSTKDRKKFPDGYDKSKEPKGKEDPKEKRSGNLEIRYDLPGKDRALWFGQENGKFLIRFSMEHEFYNYYTKQNTEAKKLINKLVVSFCESLSESRKYSTLSDEFDTLQDNLLMLFSYRLGAYNKD